MVAMFSTIRTLDARAGIGLARPGTVNPQSVHGKFADIITGGGNAQVALRVLDRIPPRALDRPPERPSPRQSHRMPREAGACHAAGPEATASRWSDILKEIPPCITPHE